MISASFTYDGGHFSDRYPLLNRLSGGIALNYSSDSSHHSIKEEEGKDGMKPRSSMPGKEFTPGSPLDATSV